jgi:hypothetical protein
MLTLGDLCPELSALLPRPNIPLPQDNRGQNSTRIVAPRAVLIPEDLQVSIPAPTSPIRKISALPISRAHAATLFENWEPLDEGFLRFLKADRSEVVRGRYSGPLAPITPESVEYPDPTPVPRSERKKRRRRWYSSRPRGA